MFNKVLIANRGAIAVRIIRTLKRLNIQSVCVYHEADENSLHVQHADEAYCLGGGSVAESYLNGERIIEIAKKSRAEAIHPGYGFLSENTSFVALCESANITFIGPTVAQMNTFGLKHLARETAEKAGTPLVPGSPLLDSLDDARNWAKQVGFPVMLKSSAGGGGIGMRICHSEQELTEAWDAVKRLSKNYFSDDSVFLEKFVANARHIEVQILGDGKGETISLGERDCSAQRRNQKVIEETPAPNLSESKRSEICKRAESLMSSVNYRNAGTVEFIYDTDTDAFYFLEVNTRLQVEHGVTEEVWGIDLVEQMLNIASAQDTNLLSLKSSLNAKGHAIQVRVYAENTLEDFQPSAGLLSAVTFPTEANLRTDYWIQTGIEVSPLFDPMLAKIITKGHDRAEALLTLQSALNQTQIYGIETNLHYLSTLLRGPECQNGRLLTNTLASFNYQSHSLSVLSPGTQTTIQDFPGREGLWHIGVPPSGPMDSYSFRLANKLLANSKDCAALEITLMGPTIKFHSDTRIALCGAPFEFYIDDIEVAQNASIHVKKGQIVRIGKTLRGGARAYLAIEGGINCPDYLDSKATFTLGQFGGHNGRSLNAGDVLHLNSSDTKPNSLTSVQQHVDFNGSWTLRVIYGPHGAPDFFTDVDIEEFFKNTWEVHYNSSRTGVRLIGPKPDWARDTGGEAGLHPSNIHDNAYAFGTVDFTGDMPVILGPDGPSLGGFVCPATVIEADRWKLGQLKAGDKITFQAVTIEDARQAETTLTDNINALLFSDNPISIAQPSPIIERSQFDGDELVIRTAGDNFLLVEIGPQELDIIRRFKVHELMLWLEENKAPGIKELTPGIRSLQIHYDARTITVDKVVELVRSSVGTLQSHKPKPVTSRIVHLPLSWDDEACHEAIEKYTQTVRPDAPWCPSNIEFIRRINGLNTIEEVKKIVFDASYLVMGLGDVYLGAPVATPLDPRHRLVTTKYNPARTWTAENSVGIGGAYMCIYGMEGPGGYQFVGRTLQMWNRYRQTSEFSQPWLLRFFDQIRFYEVSHEELLQIRKDFPYGRYPLKIEETEFDLNNYQRFLETNSSSINTFQQQRDAAFNTELERWKATGQFTFEEESASTETSGSGEEPPEEYTAIDSTVAGTIWENKVEIDSEVKTGDVLTIVESMKMEIEVTAPCDGKIVKLFLNKGDAVAAGQSIAWIEPT